MSELEWLDIFGDSLREMIEGMGLSQREFSIETGLAESSISRYICKQQIPNLKALMRMAHVLECSIDELVDFGDIIE